MYTIQNRFNVFESCCIPQVELLKLKLDVGMQILEKSRKDSELCLSQYAAQLVR